MAPHTAGPREPEDPKGFPTTVPAPRYKGVYANERLPKDASFSEVDVSARESRTPIFPDLDVTAWSSG